MNRRLGSLFALGCCLFRQSAHAAPSQAGCTISETTYNGWKAQQISNSWVTLVVVPQLGGRLVQVTFNGHDFLFVNKQLKGQSFSAADSQAQKKWFNYGGDKIWPMPEGTQDEQHWAGAVGSVLDSAPFSFQVISRDTKCEVRLTGPPDPQIGLQYIREISIGSDSPAISFHAVMRNATGFPVKWSEQSVSQYDAADRHDPANFKQNFWAFTPQNKQSKYLNGFFVRTGQASNSSYSVRDELFTLHWMDINGEVWIDSPGEWLAVVDGDVNYTMVERFHVNRQEEYPDKATVIFYTTGRPSGRRQASPPPPTDAQAPPPIHYMEAEVNSPVVELQPGESYSMNTEWFPTRMGSEFKSATYSGVIGKPLSVSKTADGQIQLSGAFGVFFPGQLIAYFYDSGGMRISSSPVDSVSPRDVVSLSKTMPAPAEAVRVSLHLIDGQGVDRGPLGEAFIDVTAQPNH